ncbi:DNAJ heat shock N-terminal domain-containing protein [Striga hermonthica]|uniref:DNAJ heat shock N-terminal domain-containing protein n=1 Tax=Striga hermonthica TaxID=68872 RepID=A0A9N7REI6_STRHE|nr:DNAJ heat shock N-terminal domain-containing protein [Striga hermonthica]
MATPGRQNPPTNQPSLSSIKSTLKAYALPLVLLAASVFYQLVVLPRSFPPSYYNALGIPRYSSIEEVTQAYEEIISKWNSSVEEVPQTVDLIKVQYAYELLTNHLLKRDYDVYNIDEYSHVLEKAKEQLSGKPIAEIGRRLIDSAYFDPDQDLGLITAQNFLSTFEDDKALLLQIISLGSNRCAEFSITWKRIVNLLNGVANTGIVELGDVQLAVHLAEKKPSGQPFFRSGVPALLAFPPGCKSASCLQRYDGDLSVDSITDWLATSILSLPRIPFYSKDSLVHNFLVKSKPHLVKVIFISKTGERATPFIRQAARSYSSYASFAFALWKEEESTYWWNMFGVESAPAIVFMKDPGVQPVVYHGPINSSLFTDIVEKNKHFVLPQLRNLTAMELGCDVHGYSRAGTDTKIWYCALVAGRPSQELNKMRETMRRVQETLTDADEIDIDDQEPQLTPAALALKQKRLTFAWLDGEAQHRYCFFNIHSDDSYESCGTRRGITDVAQLFIVRYERHPNSENLDTPKQPNNIFHAWHHPESDPVSSLVAKYNGSTEVSEIINWVSQTIKDGDTREIPPFKTKAPELVPEDPPQLWSQSSKKLVSSKQLSKSLINLLSDYLGDPRIGPSLLLLALMSSGMIWLNRSRMIQSSNQNKSNQQKEDEDRRRRSRARESLNKLIPPSMTDEEPKDARQMALSESDSE